MTDRVRASSILYCLYFFFAGLSLSGCDGGNAGAGDDFVFTGTNSVSGPSSVTFNFVRAMSPLEVPSDTAKIRFQFFNGQDGAGTLVQQDVRDFAPTITISPVDPDAESVVVTALSQEGYPRLEAVVLLSGGDEEVGFNDVEPRVITPEAVTVTPTTASIEVGQTRAYGAAVLFTNGETVIPSVSAIEWEATNQATIDAGGLATGNADGVSTITATFESVVGTAQLTIGAGLQLTRLEVSPDNASVSLGSDIPFSVVGLDQNDGPFSLEGLQVVWSATGDAVIDADTGVATGTGLVPDTLQGSATITATVGSVFGSTGLTIIGMPGNLLSIDTTPDPLLLDLDSPLGSLTSIGDFQNGPDTVLTNAEHGLLYAVTGNPGVATVNVVTGEVTAIAQGTTEVTASTAGQSDVVTVQVDFGAAGNVAPVVTLDATFVGDYSTPTSAFPNAGVSDPTQAAFVGGTLTVIDLEGNATITLPISPGIGAITGNGSDTVSVALTTSATPANVQAVLRNSTISGSDGLAQVEVTVTDGLGLDGTAQRIFSPDALVLSDGMAHTFDTDTGLLDSEAVPRSGWDGTTLTVTSFQLGTGTTLNVSGSQPFSVMATDAGGILVEGTIDFSGGIELSAQSDINVTGTLDASGADGAVGTGGAPGTPAGDGGNGGSGGAVTLFAVGNLQLTGTVDIQGGNGGTGGSLNGTGSAIGARTAGRGGDGGDEGTVSFTAGGTLTNSAILMTGAGVGGDGGSVTATSTLFTPSSITAGDGGDGGAGTVGGSGGNGGDVSVGGTVNSPNTVLSGSGGNGGDGVTSGDGGTGGSVSIGGNVNTPNTVLGGNGGAGGNGEQGGNGGDGGSVTVTGNAGVAVAAGDGGPGGDGTVAGGDGGDGGSVTVGSGTPGSGGSGGAGGNPGGNAGSSGTP
jgi:Bacterial Ig-like domain (group 2)